MTGKRDIPQRGESEPVAGTLQAFYETGMESLGWVLLNEQEASEAGSPWQGTYFLKSGDHLKVFNDAARKEVLWEGEVDLYWGQNAQWNQTGVAYQDWLDMFVANKQAILTTKEARTKQLMEKTERAYRQHQAEQHKKRRRRVARRLRGSAPSRKPPTS